MSLLQGLAPAPGYRQNVCVAKDAPQILGVLPVRLAPGVVQVATEVFNVVALHPSHFGMGATPLPCFGDPAAEPVVPFPPILVTVERGHCTDSVETGERRRSATTVLMACTTSRRSHVDLDSVSSSRSRSISVSTSLGRVTVMVMFDSFIVTVRK
jgi:hypothetical protein